MGYAVDDNPWIVLSGALTAFNLPNDVVTSIMTLVKAGTRETVARLPRQKTAGEVAAYFLKRSLRRPDRLDGGMISDPAWNMLMAIFTAQEAGAAITASSATYASGAPSTTALRYLKALEANGHVIRRPDPRDGRSVRYLLSPSTFDIMDAMIREFCVAPPLQGKPAVALRAVG